MRIFFASVTGHPTLWPSDVPPFPYVHCMQWKRRPPYPLVNPDLILIALFPCLNQVKMHNQIDPDPGSVFQAQLVTKCTTWQNFRMTSHFVQNLCKGIVLTLSFILVLVLTIYHLLSHQLTAFVTVIFVWPLYLRQWKGKRLAFAFLL